MTCDDCGPVLAIKSELSEVKSDIKLLVRLVSLLLGNHKDSVNESQAEQQPQRAAGFALSGEGDPSEVLNTTASEPQEVFVKAELLDGQQEDGMELENNGSFSFIPGPRFSHDVLPVEQCQSASGNHQATSLAASTKTVAPLHHAARAASSTARHFAPNLQSPSRTTAKQRHHFKRPPGATLFPAFALEAMGLRPRDQSSALEPLPLASSISHGLLTPAGSSRNGPGIYNGDLLGLQHPMPSSQESEDIVKDDAALLATCFNCGECFVSQQELQEHANACGTAAQQPHDSSVNSDRPWKCETCGRDFLRKGHLQEHFEAAHMGVYFVCACGKRFSRKRNKLQHERNHCKPEQSKSNGEDFTN